MRLAARIVFFLSVKICTRFCYRYCARDITRSLYCVHSFVSADLGAFTNPEISHTDKLSEFKPRAGYKGMSPRGLRKTEIESTDFIEIFASLKLPKFNMSL
jgi:hypothetical protein